MTVEKSDENKIIYNNNHITVEIIPTNEIMKLFYNHMKQNCNYSSYDNYDIESENMKLHTSTEYYRNIEFNISDNIKCLCNDKLKFVFRDGQVVNYDKNIELCTNVDEKYNMSNITFIQRIESKCVRNILSYIMEKIYDDLNVEKINILSYVNPNEISEKFCYGNTGRTRCEKHIMEFIVSKLFNCELNNDNLLCFMLLLYFVRTNNSRNSFTICFENNYNKYLNGNIYIHFAEKNITTIIKKFNSISVPEDIDDEILMANITTMFNIIPKTIGSSVKETRYDYGRDERHEVSGIVYNIFEGFIRLEGKYIIKNIFVNYESHMFFENELKKCENEIKNKCKNEMNNKKIKLIIMNIGKKQVGYDELYNYFHKWYVSKLLIDNKRSENINIYNINIVTIDEKTTVENPEYIEWNEKKNLLSELVSKNVKFDIEQLKIPNKTIDIIKKTTSIKCDEINKCFKNLDTLYLQQEYENKLLSVLNMFKNNKNRYIELGLPYKIGCLFHGLPGTGKTTTIKAIATYLCKNIYYVNLNAVKTNNDLRKIFDFVMDGSACGGVIVFEDIDCMTDIVHKRTDNTTANITTITEKGDDCLSLSYLLNLLDGTITKDECVFIMTTNHKEKLDSAIYRPGRIDVDIEFKLCDHYQIKKIFKTYINRDINIDILNRIKEYTYSPAEIISYISSYALDNNFPDETIMSKFISS